MASAGRATCLGLGASLGMPHLLTRGPCVTAGTRVPREALCLLSGRTLLCHAHLAAGRGGPAQGR